MITNEELEKLENFVGYGRIDAEIIFMGIEEAGGGLANLKERLKISDYKYLDCKRFHLDFLKIHPDKLHSDTKNFDSIKFQPVWRYMSYLMLRLNGWQKEEIFQNRRLKLREYQSDFLGTKSEKGQTLLTEIYPIPCGGFKYWGTKEENYEGIITQYKNKDEYKTKVLTRRKQIFQAIISDEKFQAKAIICYGKSVWQEYINFFRGLGVSLDYTDTHQNYKVGVLNDKTKIILIPFLGQGQISYVMLDKIVEIINDIK